MPFSSAPSSLKRRHASPEISDSENVDPNVSRSLSKRKRAGFGDDVSSSKAPRYSLTTVPSGKPRLSTASTLTPRLDTYHMSVAPSSAPAAAGRSPTRSKHQGVVSRKRFIPPSFGTKSPSLSIAAALSGTLAHKRAKKARTLEESKPNSWFFDIYEETEEQQDYTVNEWTMTQSATILDISDDESKSRERDDRGKENIPPNEVPAALPTDTSQASAMAKIPSSRKDMMTDEPRTPLGDLNPVEYYAEGLDASSVVLVPNDTAETEKAGPSDVLAVPDLQSETTFEAEAVVEPEQGPRYAVDLSMLLASSAPVDDKPSLDTMDPSAELGQESAEIEIWESSSAKDEEEQTVDATFDV